ncbi:MAG: hypothetical protein Q8L84_14305 [Hyphomonas sp.]|nr:hypothetical protein [Hyphomonas sp.]
MPWPSRRRGDRRPCFHLAALARAGLISGGNPEGDGRSLKAGASSRTQTSP